LQVALSPNSGSDERVRATKFCNDFVQTASPQELCAVGFALAEHNDPMVTRSGLQFIEHAAKYHWQEIQQREEVKVRLIHFYLEFLFGLGDKSNNILFFL